ncbi:serine/threonine protein kinase-36 [Diaporthe helianthi]|uniref:Serine/threonine protein kinase-36 n=1 Tax=Diaporthe helianthi TaxID=158607 RepID=A0A2P5HZ61_DIAHE|nr:serine/threonine protein kinase-36 [Diaporthe helianthi]
MASITDSIRPVYVPFDSDEGAESIEEYKPGGFHPTHLGDLLGQEGRYRVVHKLGHGGFGTVWLCRDIGQNKWKAVKILAAVHSTGSSADLKICEMLSNMSPQEKDIHVSHVVVPEDHFWHEGPNGRHLCVVMPVLGPNLEDTAEQYDYQEEPLKKICYQLVLAMKFLHDRGICHGDFRPNNICYLMKGIDDLDEDDLLRVFGRPTLLCYVDDEEFEWRSDYQGEAEEVDGQDYPEDDFDSNEEVEASQDCAEDDVQPAYDSNEPKYIVVPPYMTKSSQYVSDEIAVIDFGESFLAANAPKSTGIPGHYCPPEGWIEDCGNFGFGSDLWALGCSIFEVRNSDVPFRYNGSLWTMLSNWEDLNGPLPEPYRSSLARQGEMDVPEDETQWVSMNLDERKESEAEHMGRVGVPGSLHMLLLLEHQYIVPLAEGEVQPPPPPRGRGSRGRLLVRPGRKLVTYEMSEREALELLDLLKRIFAWKPEDRIGPAEILSHPWFNGCRGGEHMCMAVSTSDSESMELGEYEPGLLEVLDCGIFRYVPTALRRLFWQNGGGGWW